MNVTGADLGAEDLTAATARLSGTLEPYMVRDERDWTGTALSSLYADLAVVGISPPVGASSYYRCRHPLLMLARGGARAGMAAEVSQPDDYDILIFPAHVLTPMALDLVKGLQRTGTRVVYEIDDNLHALPEEYFVGISRASVRQTIEYWIQTADALFVSTEALRERYGYMARRMFVLGNSIDFGVRDWTSLPARDPRLAGRLVIGYAGSVNHRDDWRAIGPALTAVVSRHPAAVVALTGHPELVAAWKAGLALPPEQVVSAGEIAFRDYPQRIASFDIGIAPLENTPFTACNSDIKLLEYGALGIPYVASDVVPYRELHQETEGRGGYLCETQSEWEEALTRLIEAGEERLARGTFMGEYVRRERSLEKGAALWAEAFRAVRDGLG